MLINSIKILNQNQINKFIILLILIIFSTLLETLSIGSIIPLLYLISSNEQNILIKLNELDYIPLFLKNFILNIDKPFLILTVISIFFFIILFKNLFLIFQNYYQAHFCYLIQTYQSKKLLSIYVRKNFDFYDDNSNSLLISNIVNEVAKFTSLYLMSIINLITELALLVSLTVLLLYLFPIETLFSITLLSIFGFVFISFTKKKIKFLGKQKQLSEKKRIQDLLETFQILKEIKIRQTEDYFVNKFDINTKKSFEADKINSFISKLPRILLEIIILLLILIYIVVQNFNYVDFNNLIPIIAVFMTAAIRLLPSAGKIVLSINNLKYAKPAINILHKELSDNQIYIEKFNYEAKNQVFKNYIEFENVQFKYKNSDKYIIKNLSFKLNKGELLGVSGASGTGKSTFLDLLMLLRRPNSGKIIIDGKTDLSPKIWHQSIGFLSQNANLINDTLINNILLGVSSTHQIDAKINYLLEKLELKEKINSLPGKLSFKVGDYGSKFSGGEKQRLNLIRVMSLNPEFIILDEPTSSLDYENEIRVLKLIESLKGKKTIILITHNTKNLEICDKKIFFDKKNKNQNK